MSISTRVAQHLNIMWFVIKGVYLSFNKHICWQVSVKDHDMWTPETPGEAKQHTSCPHVQPSVLLWGAQYPGCSATEVYMEECSTPRLKQGNPARAKWDACLPGQVAAEGSVEEAAVHRIVHVPIPVIVLPPGLDGQEVPIGFQLPMVILGSLVGWGRSEGMGDIPRT